MTRVLTTFVRSSICLLLTPLLAAASSAAEPPAVTLTESPDSYTLANGIVTAKIAKRSGGLTSLVYRDIECLHAEGRGRAGAYWSHAPSGAGTVTAAVTIDPKSNDGRRAEVSVKVVSGGARIGSGPGGSVVADVDIRYALGRGDSGVYTYSVFDHRPEYPATSVGEARFCAKLNDDVFDWMTVDARRNQKAITAFDWNHGQVMNMKEARRMTTGQYKGQVEHKYDYTAVQFDTPAYGWSSTARHTGVWIVNPSMEYLSGGPTKVEFCCHRDATFGDNPDAPAPPCVLNYWRSSHYGGSSCAVAAGERWTKVVGPFLIYCNAGDSPDAMWKDVLAAAGRESKAWPYDWVAGVDYPHKDQRATITGQFVLNDPQVGGTMSNLLVGLTAPDYPAPAFRGRQSTVDWQMDAKHYQFWVRAGGDGRFTIPNVRPGKYTLHAIADGVLGEYSKADITVAAGQSLDLGQLTWKPLRLGRQLWEIGTPDRTAAEFRHGDQYWQWGLYYEYPKEFPNDVNFVVGQSDPRKDWNYCQCPRPDRPNGTTWTITFDLPAADPPRGKATLRLAFAATSARRLDVQVNDRPAGDPIPLTDTGTIRRDGIRGFWYARDVTFEAALLKAGRNSLKLTIPPGNPMNGIEYDYLRLELDDTPAPR